VARTRVSYDSLSRQLRERTIERAYTSLVDGLPGSPTGTIEAPIGRDPEVPTRQAVVQGGKHARTHYEVIQEFEADSCALLRLRLETGRTHQIRVHLAAIGHSVIGDRTYGKPNTRITSPRTFLHASSVGFDHPGTGERLVIESPLPQDLRSVLASLEGALA
jgi:23S rRNA pseudouridine1911/1915/1917 synthase